MTDSSDWPFNAGRTMLIKACSDIVCVDSSMFSRNEPEPSAFTAALTRASYNRTDDSKSRCEGGLSATCGKVMS